MKKDMMQENPSTIKFFNFELDASNLKKILDFYVWLTIVNLLYGFLQEFYTQHLIMSVKILDWLPLSLLNSLVLIALLYFFRYSPYTYAFVISFSAYSSIYGDREYVRFLLMCPKLKDFPEITPKEIAKLFPIMCDFFTHLIVDKLFSDFYNILISLVFIYFAYSYRKLIRLNKKSN